MLAIRKAKGLCRRTENSDDAEEQTTAPPPGHSADPVANCTIMMSATELNDLGCGQQVQEATESAPAGELAETADVVPPQQEAATGDAQEIAPAKELAPVTPDGLESPEQTLNISEQVGAGLLAEEQTPVDPDDTLPPGGGQPMTDDQSGQSDQAAQGEAPTMVLDPAQVASSRQELVETTDPEPQTPGSKLERAADLLANADVDADPADEESVIQHYMERLLQRVASHGRDHVGEVPPSQPTMERRQQNQEPAIPVAAGNEATATSSTPTPQSDEPSPADSDHPENDPSAAAKAERPPAPEMAADLLAMRELANHSARQAIDRSDQRRFLTVAVGELLVSTVCLASSCVVIAMSPKSLNSQLIGGAIGIAFGTSMLARGASKLLNSLRLRRSLPADSESEADPEQ